MGLTLADTTMIWWIPLWIPLSRAIMDSDSRIAAKNSATLNVMTMTSEAAEYGKNVIKP